MEISYLFLANTFPLFWERILGSCCKMEFLSKSKFGSKFVFFCMKHLQNVENWLKFGKFTRLWMILFLAMLCKVLSSFALNIVCLLLNFIWINCGSIYATKIKFWKCWPFNFFLQCLFVRIIIVLWCQYY